VTRFRWLLAALGVVSAILAVRFAVRFPWAGTVEAIEGADWTLLGAAALANLASLGFKGWAWYLLLRPAAAHRWSTAQAATIVGAAVNSVSVSVSGEAARVQVLVGRDRVPLGPAISSLVWCRVVEGIGLVLFLLAAFGVLPDEPWMRPVRLAAWIALGLLAALWLGGVGPRLLARVPARWRPAVAPVRPPGARSWWAAPVALAMANWGAEWLAYHWCIGATHIPASPTVSLAALVVANIGGIFRVTPGNVGVLQASLVLGMVPFGISGDQALAAGLVLQAVQVVPVLALGIGLVGVQGFRSLTARRARAVPAV